MYFLLSENTRLLQLPFLRPFPPTQFCPCAGVDSFVPSPLIGSPAPYEDGVVPKRAFGAVGLLLNLTDGIKDGNPLGTDDSPTLRLVPLGTSVGVDDNFALGADEGYDNSNDG